MDDTADITDNTGTIDAEVITGFGLGQTVTYQNIENLDILLGSGNDTINVINTVAGVATGISGNEGDDVVNVQVLKLSTIP